MISGVKNKHFCKKCGADLSKEKATSLIMCLDFVDHYERHYRCIKCDNRIIVSEKCKREW